MEKINKGLFWGIIASESIHVFCCGLPTLFSILSVLAGLGLIATLPGFVDVAHTMMHSYELPMIYVSGFILGLGWMLYIYSKKVNCQTQGTCCHEPCEPKKDRTHHFMAVATMLFIVNVSIYSVFHRNDGGVFDIAQNQAIMHDDHIHDTHGHAHNNNYQ